MENKLLNKKYQEAMEKNLQSQRAQDLEPMFKPIHSKTMSLVGMLKQYATAGGNASNDATERIFSPVKIDRQASGEYEKRTRRRSDVLLRKAP